MKRRLAALTALCLLLAPFSASLSEEAANYEIAAETPDEFAEAVFSEDVEDDYGEISFDLMGEESGEAQPLALDEYCAEDVGAAPAPDPANAVYHGYIEPGVDREDRFDAYARSIFGIEDKERAVAKRGTPVLSDAAQAAYLRLGGYIQEIASGTRTDTRLELGGSFDADTLTDIFHALDLNYGPELYWWNGHYSFDGLYTRISFYVDDAYRDQSAAESVRSFTVDPSAIQAVKAAFDKAQKIVTDNASLSDYDKLKAYNDTICDLVDYDNDVKDSDDDIRYTQYLVNVFDDDPSTKVVCAGYARAFQYLCDQSTFQGDVKVLYATGVAKNSNQNHGWNLVRLGGSVYLVDVTWCDTSSTDGEGNNYYFMIGAKAGSVSEGYQYTGMLRTYDAQTLKLTAENELKVSNHSYLADQAAKYGAQVLDLAALSATEDDEAHVALTVEAGKTCFIECTDPAVLQFTSSLTTSADIAAIDENGVLKAIAVGTDTIFCPVLYNNSFKYLYVDLTVTEPAQDPDETPVDGPSETPDEKTAEEDTDTPSETPVEAPDEVPAETLPGETTETEIPVDDPTGEPSGKPDEDAPAQDPDIPTVVLTSNTTITRQVGDEFQIDLAGQAVKSFKSSSSKVISVSDTGRVRVLKESSKAIRVTVTLKNKKRLVLSLLTVDPASVVRVEIDGANAEMDIGATATLTAELTAMNPNLTPNNSKLIWRSSNTKVVRVDSTGRLTAVGKGTADVTVTTDNKTTDTVTLSVVDPFVPTAVSIEMPDDEPLWVKDKVLFIANVTSEKEPARAKLTWKSSKPKVATVDKYGWVTAKSSGHALISVTTNNHLKAFVDIEVIDPSMPTDIAIAPEAPEPLLVKDTVRLEAVVTALGEPTSKITWSTSDKKIATVDKTGLVTGKADGEVTITATTSNKLKASVTLRVVDATSPTSVDIEPAIVDPMRPQQTLQLQAVMTALGIPNNRVIWSTSSAKVASVDKQGVVTANQPGTAVITVTTANGLTASVVINVE